MTHNLLRAFAAAAVLTLAAPSWGAGKPPPVSAVQVVKTGIAKARALIRAGRFEEALEVLAPLVGGETVQADALFQYGLAAIGASQQPGVSEDERDALLAEAIGVFHAMLVRRPELVRVRLELGRAFFLKGEDTLARRQFEQVLAGKPPAAVALNVNRFLSQIRARKRWTLRVGMALAPDTNVGAASGEEIIWIPVGGQRLPFTLDDPAREKSGIGLSAWVGGEYQYPLADRWRLRAGADLSRREYRRSEFDRMTVGTHVGPRWLVGRYAEASLLASIRRHWLANDPDHRDLGLRAEVRRRLTRRMSATLRGSWHDRKYDERTWLDGSVTDLSLSASHAFGPTLRGNLGVGWGKDRTEAERYRHDRRWAQAGITAALPWGFTVGANLTLRWTDYEGNWSFYTGSESPRRDLTRSIRLNAFNRGLTVEGFSPQVSLVREDRTSNAQLHGYERTFGELRFVRLF